MRSSYKIIIIAAAVLLVALLGYFVWRSLSETAMPPPAELSTSTLPFAPTAPATKVYPQEIKAENGTVLRRVSGQPIFDFWVSRVNGEVFYITPDGKIASVKGGAGVDVSGETVTPLNRVIPNAQGTRALVAFGNPLSPSWRIFDAQDSAWRPLPAELKEAAWGVKPNEIIGLIRSGSDSSLVLFDYTQTPTKYTVWVKDFRITDAEFVLQSPNTLLISERPSFMYSARLWRFDLKTQTLSTLIEAERGLMSKWDDTFKTLFVSYAPNEFSILDEKLGLKTPVIFATFPQKCAAYASSSAYCFVPRQLSTKESPSVIPDDYLMRKLYTIDNLFAADETDGITKILSGDTETVPALDAFHVTYAPGKLYFMNRYDNFLYELTLP